MRLAIALVVSFGLWGCGDDSTSTTCTPSGGECAAGAVCVSGRCVTPQPCTRNRDCGADQVCARSSTGMSACVPKRNVPGCSEEAAIATACSAARDVVGGDPTFCVGARFVSCGAMTTCDECADESSCDLAAGCTTLDAGTMRDAGSTGDAGTTDDAGSGMDGGPRPDAGRTDAGVTAGIPIGVPGEVEIGPVIAASATQWGVAWRVSTSMMRFTTVDEGGVPATPLLLATEEGTLTRWWVAANGDRFGVVWEIGTTTAPAATCRFAEVLAGVASAPVEIFPCSVPALVPAGTGWLVVMNFTGPPGPNQVVSRTISSAGVLGAEVTISSGLGFDLQLDAASDGGRIWVSAPSSSRNDNVWELDASGAVIQGPVTLPIEFGTMVALPGGDVIVGGALTTPSLYHLSRDPLALTATRDFDPGTGVPSWNGPLAASMPNVAVVGPDSTVVFITPEATAAVGTPVALAPIAPVDNHCMATLTTATSSQLGIVGSPPAMPTVYFVHTPSR